MISVVTVTYNNFQELKDTLQPLSHCKNIESIIINGGNCQQTQEFLESYSGASISERDEGIADAFNKGVELSTGDAIVFLNSGDFLIDTTYYQKADVIFRENDDIDFIYSDITFVHSELTDLLVKPNLNFIGKMPFPHPSLIVRKKIFDQIGQFDSSFKTAMDFDFVYRMLYAKAKGFYYQEGPVVKMIGNGVSSTQGTQGLKERVKVLKKCDLWNYSTKNYVWKLYTKECIRSFLSCLHLLKSYDAIKYKWKKLKPE